MGIEWNQDLSTGDDEIDGQHRELFSRVNALLDACGTGKGRNEVGGLIGFLEDYVITHFSAEERIMTRIGYPGYQEHKGEHDMFIGRIAELKDKFIKEGDGVHVVLLTIRTSMEWLTGHIRKSDKALGAAMRCCRPAR